MVVALFIFKTDLLLVCLACFIQSETVRNKNRAGSTSVATVTHEFSSGFVALPLAAVLGLIWFSGENSWQCRRWTVTFFASRKFTTSVPKSDTSATEGSPEWDVQRAKLVTRNTLKIWAGNSHSVLGIHQMRKWFHSWSSFEPSFLLPSFLNE